MNLQECLIHATLATRLGQPDYGIACCQQILKRFPGHLRAKSLLGQAFLEKGNLAESASQFESILEQDPENILARSGFAVALEKQGQLKKATGELERAFDINPGNIEVREGLLALRSQLDRVNKGIDLGPAALGRILAKRQKSVEALESYSQVLETSPHRIDVHLAKVHALWESGRKNETEQACLKAIELSPKALKAKAILALTMLKKGDEDRGVALLHEVRAEDPSDSVLEPLLRQSGIEFPNPYSLIEMGTIPGELPQEIALALGAGITMDWQEETIEDLPALGRELEAKLGPRESLSELEMVASRLSEHMNPSSIRSDGRGGAQQAYAIVTSVQKLEKRFGKEGAKAVGRKLDAIQNALSYDGFAAYLLFVDDQESLAQFGLTPVRPERPQEIKRIIDSLESNCASKLETLKYVLLVGGDEIIPFFRLANPTDDDDALVLSDAPYSAAVGGLYSPIRAVGRIPDGASESPSFLLSALDSMLGRRVYSDISFGFWRYLGWFFDLFNPGKQNGKSKTLGYTALVWKPATEEVYSQIGDSRSLRVSPPMTDRSVELRWFEQRSFGLYNLHGSEDSPYWYGQKDGSYPVDYPAFPVALSPESLKDVDASDAIIFSEACYGANIIGKDPSTSLALQFLNLGAACVVGSTKIAYGSTEPPLVGADLLAKYFWENLTAGYTAGESLVQAKSQFIGETQARQGYLDGDDQKTAIEFILLGDPSAKLPSAFSLTKKNGHALSVTENEEEICPSLFCKRRARALEQTVVTGDVLAKVRKHLQRVGPDVYEGTLSVLPREICASNDKRHVCRGTCLIRGDKRPPAGAYMVTSRKSIQALDGSNLFRVARVTVDEQGSLLKLAISK